MNPTNPSSNDPNEPYRRAIQALADGYNYVPYPNATQVQTQELAAAEPQPDPRWQGLPLLPSSVASPSNRSRPEDPLQSIRSLLKANSFDYDRVRISRSVVDSRVSHARVSYQTLLTALQIASEGEHPLMMSLHADDVDQTVIMTELSGFLRSQGWRPQTLVTLQNAHNDPFNIIIGLFYDYHSLQDRRRWS